MIGAVMEARRQALDALEQANTIRIERARTRRKIASGDLTAQQVILDPPDEMQTASVAYVLGSVRGAAEGKIGAVCGSVGVSPNRRLRDLTERQRRALVEAMGNFNCFGRGSAA